MSIQGIISTIKHEVILAFAAVDSWFDKEVLLQHNSACGGESSMQVIERIMHTNHYLLNIIDRCISETPAPGDGSDIETISANYIFHAPLLGEEHKTRLQNEVLKFRNTHETKASDIWAELRWQLYTCLNYLEILKNGEGLLYNTAVGLIRMDVYQCIYLLTMMIQENVAVMNEFEKEYEK